ncbi:hypothetical protein Ancab_036150 [Ancistrocladus abbreviatus]
MVLLQYTKSKTTTKCQNCPQQPNTILFSQAPTATLAQPHQPVKPHYHHLLLLPPFPSTITTSPVSHFILPPVHYTRFLPSSFTPKPNMPQHHHTSSQLQAIIFFSLLISLLPTSLALQQDPNPDPDPEPIQQQTFLPTPTNYSQSPSTTIPSFPEQTAFAGCPLNLPDDLFAAVKSSCTTNVGKKGSGSVQQELLHRSRCCPVLGAWLYWAYSETALGRSSRGGGSATAAAAYDMMPLLPDDSETCVDGVEKAMRERGVDLGKENETCDVVYCYCGIRLHPLSCPASFYAAEKGNGEMVVDQRVRSLESDCLSRNARGSNSRASCSNCLNSLYQLKRGEIGSSGKPEDRRTTKMHSRECELMGLTWLLAKNRTAYIDTVTAVFRALMMSGEGSDPRSCSLNSDGMPLAVDSTEISSQSSAATTLPPLFSLFLLLVFSF